MKWLVVVCMQKAHAMYELVLNDLLISTHTATYIVHTCTHICANVHTHSRLHMSTYTHPHTVRHTHSHRYYNTVYNCIYSIVYCVYIVYIATIKLHVLIFCHVCYKHTVNCSLRRLQFWNHSELCTVLFPKIPWYSMKLKALYCTKNCSMFITFLFHLQALTGVNVQITTALSPGHVLGSLMPSPYLPTHHVLYYCAIVEHGTWWSYVCIIGKVLESLYTLYHINPFIRQ